MMNVTCAKCHILAVYAECHYAACRYAECRGATNSSWEFALSYQFLIRN